MRWQVTRIVRGRRSIGSQRALGWSPTPPDAVDASLVGLTGKVRPDEVHAYALGSHGPEMVVPLSQATANGRRLSEILDGATLSAIIERTRDSGAEVVKLLQTGSAYFAPGQSAELAESWELYGNVPPVSRSRTWRPHW